MSIQINSSLPRTIILGFNDKSGRLVPMEPEALPQYLPLLPLHTEWGPHDDSFIVGGGAFAYIYGTRSLDVMAPYANHQTEVAKAAFGQGTVGQVVRILGEGADIARMRLSCEVLEDEIEEFERNADGTYRLDNNGDTIPTGATIGGVRARWLLEEIVESNDVITFGAGAPREGTMVNGAGRPSMIYPIIDRMARFYGERGNNIGQRIAAPTMMSNIPVDGDVIDDMGAYIYRMWVAERADISSSSRVFPTLSGEQYLDFTLKANTVDKHTERSYFLGDTGKEAWESDDPTSDGLYGRFGDMHIYEANVQLIQDMIYANESGFDVVNRESIDPAGTLNLFGAVHYNNVPYHTFVVEGPIGGGLNFSENTTHYAMGGADGDMTETGFDNSVNELMTDFPNGQIPFYDSARYPFSAFIDSGFSLDTKKKFVNLFHRPDVYFIASTQDATRRLNTPSEDSSVCIALRSYYRSIPESDWYGTAACRAVVMANAGRYIPSNYRGNLPFTIGFSSRIASYMGSSDGYMKPRYRFDRAPGNVISDYRLHNAVTRPEPSRNTDWKNGMVFAQSFDTRQVFWAGMQTIYDDETSIFNTFFNVAIGCNLTRVGEQAWRNFVNDAQMSDELYVAEVDRWITEKTVGRYDGRVDVTPRSDYSRLDKTRGYSWTTEIEMAGQSSKTVATLTITGTRRGDTDGGNV